MLSHSHNGVERTSFYTIMSVSVVEYEAERNLLISQDRAWRADKCRGPLTDVEITADAAMRKLRAAEAESVWGAEHLNVPHVFPGMEFLSGMSILLSFHPQIR